LSTLAFSYGFATARSVLLALSTNTTLTFGTIRVLFAAAGSIDGTGAIDTLVIGGATSLSGTDVVDALSVDTELIGVAICAVFATRQLFALSADALLRDLAIRIQFAGRRNATGPTGTELTGRTIGSAFAAFEIFTGSFDTLLCLRTLLVADAFSAFCFATTFLNTLFVVRAIIIAGTSAGDRSTFTGFDRILTILFNADFIKTTFFTSAGNDGLKSLFLTVGECQSAGVLTIGVIGVTDEITHGPVNAVFGVFTEDTIQLVGIVTGVRACGRISAVNQRKTAKQQEENHPDPGLQHNLQAPCKTNLSKRFREL
jgi:hypothetical protein